MEEARGRESGRAVSESQADDAAAPRNFAKGPRSATAHRAARRAGTMHRRRLLVTLAALVALSGNGAQNVPEIPPFLKVCHRSDPHLSECIKRSVDSLRPYLKTGIPVLHIPPCEPLSVARMDLNQASGPVSVSSTYTNIKIWGATDFVLKSIRIDMAKNRIRMKLFVPRLEMRCDYKMTGKILLLPIIGEGKAQGNYTDIDVMVTVQGERYIEPRTGKLHFRVLDFYCDFEVGHASIHLGNLFNGDVVLSDAMNLFLNDNWNIVAAEIKPALESTMSALFKNFANKIYSKYPINTLLPL